MMLLAQFVLCAALIAWAGFVLARSADRLAAAYGWGRGWVGLAMLATITSLPELASGISAAAWVGAPNLAVGGALGACVFNLGFLVVVDLLQRHHPIYHAASSTHLLTAAFGVIMLGFVAMSVLMGHHAPALLHVGLYSPVLLVLYLLALKSVQRHERESAVAQAAAQAAARPDREWRRFGASAAVVAAAGLWLPQLGVQLAAQLGLSRSFVGTVFMALVTTLPEMAVTVAALRLGALDLAMANLLGSNLFNVIVLAVVDASYLRGPILAEVHLVHAGTAVTAAVMSGLVIVGLVLRPRGRMLRTVSWVSVGLAAAYTVNMLLAYLQGAN